jgi:hypothetical protein
LGTVIAGETRVVDVPGRPPKTPGVGGGARAFAPAPGLGPRLLVPDPGTAPSDEDVPPGALGNELSIVGA